MKLTFAELLVLMKHGIIPRPWLDTYKEMNPRSREYIFCRIDYLGGLIAIAGIIFAFGSATLLIEFPPFDIFFRYSIAALATVWSAVVIIHFLLSQAVYEKFTRVMNEAIDLSEQDLQKLRSAFENRAIELRDQKLEQYALNMLESSPTSADFIDHRARLLQSANAYTEVGLADMDVIITQSVRRARAVLAIKAEAKAELEIAVADALKSGSNDSEPTDSKSEEKKPKDPLEDYLATAIS